VTGGTEAEGFAPETAPPIAALAAAQLAATWYARPNDLIGGWCVMPADEPPSSGPPEVASFASETVAQHIADLHNEWLETLRAAAGGPR
jgi:hypothetical protein